MVLPWTSDQSKCLGGGFWLRDGHVRKVMSGPDKVSEFSVKITASVWEVGFG